MHRRSATRVVGGRVLRKNDWRPHHGDYIAVPQAEIRIDRRSPPPGFRHLITVAQLRDFLDLLCDWEEMAVGLDAVVLDDATHTMGWHRYGVVAVCPWERELWWPDADDWFVGEHRDILDRLGVDVRRAGEQTVLRWTEPQARGFQLLHVLPHELGHHRDRVTTRRAQRAGRGERFAEAYARRVMDDVWDSYIEAFGL